MKRIQKILAFLLCFVMMLPNVGCSSHEHKVVKKVGVAPTCLSGGTLEHFQCVVCDKLFADKACTKELKSYEINLGKSSHDIKYNPVVPSTPDEVGTKAYYSCTVCEKYFTDEFGKNEISEEDLVLGKYNYVDFTITVDSGKEPVILQLADPQMMDSSTRRSDNKDLSADAIKYWNKDSRQELAYDLMSEVINASKPDLILVSGDNVYGKYDDDGHLHEEFVEFMESFSIPWAPILGNHDIETTKGVDWICDLYEAAPNCLFKKHTTNSNDTISGHGNYTIGIAQDGEMKRVIFNMDTNGCTGASGVSKSCPQTIYQTNNSYGTSYGAYGLQQDQVAWFEDTTEKITGEYAGVKLSLHIHVPMNKVYTAINDAYKEKVGDPVARVYYHGRIVSGARANFVAPERVKGHNEGDFGIAYSLYDASFTECWDTDKTNGAGTQDQIYDRIKAQGVDSIFLGHMHSDSISIVYDGIRFQFGQKCTLYDSVQRINNSTGAVDAVAAHAINSGETALVGGTVMKLNAAGEIADAYIEYNTGYGKEVNWSKYYNTIG